MNKENFREVVVDNNSIPNCKSDSAKNKSRILVNPEISNEIGHKHVDLVVPKNMKELDLSIKFNPKNLDNVLFSFIPTAYEIKRNEENKILSCEAEIERLKKKNEELKNEQINTYKTISEQTKQINEKVEEIILNNANDRFVNSLRVSEEITVLAFMLSATTLKSGMGVAVNDLYVAYIQFCKNMGKTNSPLGYANFFLVLQELNYNFVKESDKSIKDLMLVNYILLSKDKRRTDYDQLMIEANQFVMNK